MNIKKFVLSSIVIFIIALLWNYVLHGVILTIESEAVKNLFRTDMKDKLWLSMIIALIIIMIFVYGYARISSKGTVLEGALYGFIFGITAGLLVDVNQYILYPLPASLVIKWFLFGVLEFTIYGVLVSRLYRKKLIISNE